MSKRGIKLSGGVILLSVTVLVGLAVAANTSSIYARAQSTSTATRRPKASATTRHAAATAGASATATKRPSATSTARPSATHMARPSATATARPSATPTARPSATPTARPSATSTTQPSPTTAAALATVDPAILGSCTAAIHDRYVVTGPDGKLYRTWHPQVVPIDPNNPGAGSCTFAHEHGDNPAMSVANPHMPAFGYIGAQVGDTEVHEGFKVAVINQGTTNDEGGVAQNSTRLVFHQGTGGAKRFDTEFHSLMFDLVAPDGHYVHVQGMADTGAVGSICANPRQGRTVVVTTGCAITSLYEIWAGTLNVGGRALINFSMAVFDPITVLDPNSLPGQRPTLYSANIFPQLRAPDYGCDREAYSGPVYWYNQNGPATFYTDGYGNLAASGLQQQVSLNNSIGIEMSSSNFYQMKLHRSQCADGLGLKN